MSASFEVHRHPVGTRIRESRNVKIGVLNHQMTIERELGRLPQRTHQLRSERDVRHEMTIHDIDVDDRAAAFRGPADLLAQTREIRRQNRGC